MTLAQGKPTLIVELTPNYDLMPPIIAGGVKGVLNVLRHLKMVDGEPEPQRDLPIINELLGPQLRVTHDRSGFVYPQAPVGS